jgi:hypothetical protein
MNVLSYESISQSVRFVTENPNLKKEFLTINKKPETLTINFIIIQKTNQEFICSFANEFINREKKFHRSAKYL